MSVACGIWVVWWDVMVRIDKVATELRKVPFLPWVTLRLSFLDVSAPH